MQPFAQCTELQALQDFSAKVTGSKGRPLQVRKGDVFWVVTAAHAQKPELVEIARKGRTSRYPFTRAQLDELFRAVSR